MEDRVTLRYYGHSAFLFVTPGQSRMLIDPFRNPPPEERPRWFMRYFPSIEVDVVLVSHPHFDHDAINRVRGEPSIIRTTGVFSRDDFRVEAVSDQHSKNGNRYDFSNLIFVLQIAGVSFCHIGDNRSEIPMDIRDHLGEIDVLMVTVDDSMHLLTFEEVDHLIEFLNPKVVIPMHYLISGLIDPVSTLKTPDYWLKGQNRVVRIDSKEVKISRDDLPVFREIWFFEKYAEK